MGPSRNEQKVEKHDDNILIKKEIESWKDFEYDLMEENRLLFSKMLSKCGKNEDYIRAASSKDEYFSAVLLFFLLRSNRMSTRLVLHLLRLFVLQI
jgi:hypothetical protein